MSAEPQRPHESELPPELLRAGEPVGRLPSPTPPPGLAERTLARIEREVFATRAQKASSPAQAPARRLSLWLRPITHPAARVAAGFLLVAALALITNPHTSERLGQAVEVLIGPRATHKVEALVDHILPTYGALDLQESRRLSWRPPLPKPRTNETPSSSIHANNPSA